jgi:hypothetical protein
MGQLLAARSVVIEDHIDRRQIGFCERSMPSVHGTSVPGGGGAVQRSRRQQLPVEGVGVVHPAVPGRRRSAAPPSRGTSQTGRSSASSCIDAGPLEPGPLRAETSLHPPAQIRLVTATGPATRAAAAAARSTDVRRPASTVSLRSRTRAGAAPLPIEARPSGPGRSTEQPMNCGPRLSRELCPWLRKSASRRRRRRRRKPLPAPCLQCLVQRSRSSGPAR